MNDDRNRWRGQRSDCVLGVVTIPGRVSADLGRHSDGHGWALQGLAAGAVHAPPVQPLRVRVADAAEPSSDGGSDQRPHCDRDAEPSRWRSAAPASRFDAHRSVVLCGAGRTSSSRVDGPAVGPDADGAGPAVAKRAQHPDNGVITTTIKRISQIERSRSVPGTVLLQAGFRQGEQTGRGAQRACVVSSPTMHAATYRSPLS